MVSTELNYRDTKSFFLKKRFKVSKKAIAIMALIILIISIGLIVYSYKKEQNNLQASNAYTNVLIAMKSNDRASATNYCLSLIKNYKNSPYARLAGLFLAKIAFEDNNIELASERLLWVIESSKQDNLIKPVAIARLARLAINNKEYDKAIEIIDKQNFGPHFSVILEEVKGDALLAKGDREAAIQSYQIVAKNLSNKMNLDWLFEKLNELGVEKNVVDIKNTKDN
jgi:predicted negative regulator of RcsB-dependent stress response